jgi:hypothetical protein
MACLEVHLDASWFRDLRSLRGWFARILVCNGLFLLTVSQSFGQQVALSLSSATTIPGASAALTVSTSASGGVQPAILQWTLQYPADVTSILRDNLCAKWRPSILEPILFGPVLGICRMLCSTDLY